VQGALNTREKREKIQGGRRIDGGHQNTLPKNPKKQRFNKHEANIYLPKSQAYPCLISKPHQKGTTAE